MTTVENWNIEFIVYFRAETVLWVAIRCSYCIVICYMNYSWSVNCSEKNTKPIHMHVLAHEHNSHKIRLENYDYTHIVWQCGYAIYSKICLHCELKQSLKSAKLLTAPSLHRHLRSLKHIHYIHLNLSASLFVFSVFSKNDIICVQTVFAKCHKTV